MKKLVFLLVFLAGCRSEPMSVRTWTWSGDVKTDVRYVGKSVYEITVDGRSIDPIDVCVDVSNADKPFISSCEGVEAAGVKKAKGRNVKGYVVKLVPTKATELIEIEFTIGGEPVGPIGIIEVKQ